MESMDILQVDRVIGRGFISLSCIVAISLDGIGLAGCSPSPLVAYRNQSLTVLWGTFTIDGELCVSMRTPTGESSLAISICPQPH